MNDRVLFGELMVEGKKKKRNFKWYLPNSD
jgi:hypothetical protein